MTETADARFESVRRAGGARYAAFLAAGYREWYSRAGPKMTPYLLQKKVERGGTVLFHVNVWVYDRHADPPRPVAYMAEVQFNAHSDAPTFDVTLYDADRPAEEVEAFFASIYERMGCEPYGDG